MVRVQFPGVALVMGLRGLGDFTVNAAHAGEDAPDSVLGLWVGDCIGDGLRIVLSDPVACVGHGLFFQSFVDAMGCGVSVEYTGAPQVKPGSPGPA